MERLNKILQHPVFQETLQKLETLEAERIYCRHGLPHLLDVARAAQILNLQRKLGLAEDVVYGAALIHDIGRAAQYEIGVHHRIAGIPLAEQILAGTDFTETECAAMLQCVQYHGSDFSEAPLAAVIAEADHRTRPCFACHAADTCKWTDTERNLTLTI